ncbi:MAG: AAA family ATPase [Puia sp.]
MFFSHVPEPDKRNQASLEELIQYQSEIINEKISLIKNEIDSLNTEIIKLEKQKSPEYKKAISEGLKVKQTELESHHKNKPPVVPEPSASAEVQDQTQSFNLQIKGLRESLDKVESDVKDKNAIKLKYNLELTDITKFQQAAGIFQQQFEILRNTYKESIQQYGFDFDQLIKLSVDLGSISDRITTIQEQIVATDELLNPKVDTSLISQKKALNKTIKELQTKLDEPSKIYQEYLENIKSWTIKENEITGNNETDSTIIFFENKLKYLNEQLDLDIERNRVLRIEKVNQLFSEKLEIIRLYKELYKPVTSFISQYINLTQNYPISVTASLKVEDFTDKFFTYVSQGARGSFYGKEESISRLELMKENIDFNNASSVSKFLESIINALEFDLREGYGEDGREINNQIRKGFYSEFYSFLFGLEYLVPNYELKLDGKNVSELSPGEKGALLLIFYLVLDQDDIPLVIDQPEENLDNQSVYKILVPFIKEAKKRRQIIIVTHNPNLAVVCDAEQIIHVRIDKTDGNKVYIQAGAIENILLNEKLVEILEGTLPAFNNRDLKYSITKEKP